MIKGTLCFFLLSCTWRWWKWQWQGLDLLLWWTLTLLFLVANPPCFRLQITNLTKIKPNSTSSKRVCFGLASIFLEGCSEASDKGIKATPGLAEWAGARGRWVWVAIKRTDWSVYFGFAKLVKVAKEFKDMSTTAPGQRKRRPVVLEVLAKGVPVSALLILIATWSGGGGR